MRISWVSSDRYDLQNETFAAVAGGCHWMLNRCFYSLSVLTKEEDDDNDDDDYNGDGRLRMSDITIIMYRN